ncbi:MAG TPA: TetR/AcrR family transcriptional regulator [Pseudomonadales bacterium]|nr:TetR/AcrR family transcriptional regulator [Pseudomonadales bacterium]
MTSQPASEKLIKKGRPLEDGLRDRLLNHTIKVLLRDGYQKFSMIAVAQSAKASKETLYRQFGDKSGLLHAALIRNAALIGPLLNEGLQAAQSIEERLYRLALNYLHGCYLPEALALQRIAYADGDRGLGPIFAEEITEYAIAYIVDEFTQLGSAQPHEDAEVFLGMIQGKLHEKIMLGVVIENREEKMEQQVNHALRILAPYLQQLKSHI